MEKSSTLSPVKQALLEQRLKRASHARVSGREIPKRPDRGGALLSFVQRQMWTIDRMTPGNPAYNVPVGYRIKGALDVTALEHSVNEIINRHEALRTTFTVKDGDPLQLIHPALTIKIAVTELDHLPSEEREVRLQALASEESVRSFDLSRLPLIRVSLFKLGEAEHVLIINLHHIVADGLSIGLLLNELDTFYRAFTEGGDPCPPELAVQYGDFALWQRQTIANEAAYAKQIEFWQKQLGGTLPVLELPADRPRPALQSFNGSNVFFDIPTRLVQDLKSLGAREGCTFFMILLAAFQVLLQRYSGADDIVIGTPVGARTSRELEPLIGNFLNMAALRCDLSGNPTFIELLRRTRDTTLNAFSNSDLPFEAMLKHLTFERDPSRNPIFQVLLQVLPATAPRIGDLDVSSFHFDLKFAQVDLSLLLYEDVGGYWGRFEYCTDLFEAQTIRRLCGHYGALLQAIVRDPDRSISTLPLLNEQERQQLLVEWNETKKDYPKEKCVHELFEAQASRFPDAVAVIFEGKELTYGELNRRANLLAHYLRASGVGPDVSVGICMERSLEMIIALLGTLKAGGAYVPLDPSYPKDRLSFMIKDAKVALLLTQRHWIKILASHETPVFCLDPNWERLVKKKVENPVSQTTPGNLAYVIYTSGSTGRPKGVEIPHRGIVRLLFGVDYVQLDATQTFCHLASISFDAATFELWGALLHGAKCVLYPGTVPTPVELGNVLHQNKVSILWLTTSLFNAVFDESPEALSEVRQLFIGGESLSVKHVRRALEILPETQIVNCYGPTESTTFTSCYPIPRQLDESIRSIPIGRPIANTQIYLLDKYLHPVPIGVTGELHIGGDGLARGYVNRPELTAERFIPNPFSDEPGARLYKTGDLARYLPDGNIEFLGRIDHQVKVRGYRIELGEIETVLGQHPAVREAVVLTREDDPDDKRLVAYVVLRQEPAPTVNELRSFLKKKLPDYMVPSALVFLESLPMTPNGKIDRRTLPVPNRDTRDGNPDYIAPVKTVEHQLKQIWEDLLGVRPIGILHNFFDLGGHSLLAVQMMHRVEQVCGVQVPLSTLLVAPTIESLGKALVQQRLEENESRVVRVQSGGNKHPFFFLHGEFRAGGIFCFNLARGLGKDQPFYALTPHGLNRQPDTVPRTVEAMAKAYIEAVRTVQPEGPYLLGGFCNGGTVAFEMARQLHGCGQKVDLVVLIAAQGRNAPGMRILQCLTDGVGYLLGLKSEQKMSLFVVLRYYIRRMKNVAQLPLGEQLAWALCLAKKRIWRVTRSFAAAGSPRECVALDQAGQHENWEEDALVKIYFRALDSYVPRPYSGRVVLFCPAGEYTANLKDPTMGWGKAAPNIEVQMVPGDHVTCITRYVKTLAYKMKVCLDQAQENA